MKSDVLNNIGSFLCLRILFDLDMDLLHFSSVDLNVLKIYVLNVKFSILTTCIVQRH